MPGRVSRLKPLPPAQADPIQSNNAPLLPEMGAFPPGFDGTACFGFLNRFTYGNFGDPGQFGLES